MKDIFDMKKLCFIFIFLIVMTMLQAQEVEVFPQLGHSDIVNSVAFSPDGKMVVSGASDGTLKLWDVLNGREIRTFSGHTQSVHSVNFSSDGKQILSSSMDGTIKLWNVNNIQEIKTFTQTSIVYTACFTLDGQKIISGSGDGTVKLWNINSGKVIKTYYGHPSDVLSVSCNPHEKQFLSVSDKGTHIVWDIESGQVIRTFQWQTGQDFVYSACLSPDGKQVLSAAGTKIKLWDVASGQEIRTLSGHTGKVNSVSFSPDGKHIISGSNDKTIKLWDAVSGQEIKTFSGHIGGVSAVAFNPDGKQVITASGINIKLWDVVSGQEIKTFFGNTIGVDSVRYNPDDKQIISNPQDGIARLWDISNGHLIRNINLNTRSVSFLSFSNDGRQIYSCTFDGTVSTWDKLSGQQIKTIKLNTGITNVIGFITHGKQMYSFNSKDSIFRIWDFESGKELKNFSLGYTKLLTSILFNNDKTQILSFSQTDNIIKIWDLTSGREIRAFTGQANIRTASFNSDGKKVLSGSKDGVLTLWDFITGKEIRTFFGHTKEIHTAHFIFDEKQILSTSQDGSIRLWEAATGKELRNFPMNEYNITSIILTHNNNEILCISYNKMYLLNLLTGNVIKVFSGHTSRINTVSFTPDGKHIISSSQDGTVRLWDVATGKEIASFISFSGSDTQLLGGSRGTRDFDIVTEETATSIDGEWVVITPDGYYAASPRGDRYLNVRVGNTVTGMDSFREIFYNPDVIKARLAGEKDPPTKKTVTIQQAAKFMPPEVTLQSQTRTANSSNTTINISINDKNLPIQNIIVMVNGRRLGKDELSKVSGAKDLQPNKASLSVTGKQQVLHLTLPVTLDPGDNRIEVVVFNGFSENRRYVDVKWDAPVGVKQELPDLWILAVGVNKYDNAGAGLCNLKNLSFCVADAKGVIDSLKTQEGVRYAKVHSLLVADDAQTKPTAANIRQSFKFLEDAKPRDVVLLFLAGHGISEDGGKFFFLPSDAQISADKTVNPLRAITGDEITAVLDASGNRLVFIDACQAGGVDNDRMIRSLMDTNAFVFASSKGNEFSYELPELGHGVFTYSVIDALKGAQRARASGSISVISMSDYVRDDVPKRTQGKQNPAAYSLGFYDFELAGLKE